MANILTEKTPARSLVTVKSNINIQWRRFAIPLGIFLIAFLPRVVGLDTFLTADEDDQIMFAHLFLKSAMQGDWAGALVLGYPGVPTLILGGLGVGLRYVFHYTGWLPLEWVSADLFTTIDQVTTRFGTFDYPLDFLLWVRVPMAFVASLCVLGIYFLIKRLLDEKVALFSTLFIAFDPFILAHTRVIHVDAPLSYFMFLSFLAFLLYLDRGAWKWLFISGLFGGLAGLSKTPAALLGPILVLSGLFFALFPPAGVTRLTRFKRLGLALVGWGLIAAAAFFALWPSMWSRPLFAVEWIFRNIQSVNRSFHPTTGIFWGGQSDQSPLYYLTVFPYHLTPLATVGVAVGLVMIFSGLFAYWRGRSIIGPMSQHRDWLIRVFPMAMGLAVYIIMFIAPVSAISRRGDRYILPVFFASALLSALALWWLTTLVKRYLPVLMARLHLTPLRITTAALLIQAFFVVLYHPYYLTYYNPLMGGHKTAPFQLNVGWGEGLNEAAQYLNENVDYENAQVASWYSNQFAPYYWGQTLDLSDHSSALTGDYTVFYINQIQRGFPSKELLAYFQQRQPLHQVTLNGIDYAWIYEGPVVSQEPPTDYRFPVEVVMGGGARLVGLDVSQDTLPADAYALPPKPSAETELLTKEFRKGFVTDLEGLPVTLYWETLTKINGEHNVYIRLVDEDGNIWGQVDRLILAGLWRPDRWQGGYFLRDEYRLPIDPATPPGTYHFEVGMYDFVTGQSYGVARKIGQITLTPPQESPNPAELELETQLHMPINESLTLLGHDFVDSAVSPGAEVGSKIFWQATETIDEDYLVEFSLLAPNRKQYVIDELPLSAMYPTSQWRNGEAVGTAYRFRVPAFAPAADYAVALRVLDPRREAVGPTVTLGNIQVKALRRNFTLPDNVTPISAFLNDEIELVGYNLVDQTVAPEDTFGLTLYWRSLKPAEANYTVFVHVVGPDQVMRGQWDSMPVQGQAPTGGWLPGEIVEDHYEVPMSKDAPPWKYDIFIGMYDSDTGQRLPMISEKAPISDNRVWLTRVQGETE